MVDSINNTLVDFFGLSDSAFSSVFIFAFWILLILIIALVVIKILKKTAAFGIMLYAVFGSGCITILSLIIDKISGLFS